MSDIWSLGVILYILVTGGFPFPGDSVDKLKRAVMGGDRNLKIPFWVSVECADLIRKMLTISPVKRLSLAGIVNHRWFMAREMSTELMFLFQIGGISVPFKNKVTTSSPSKSLLTTSPSFGSCASKQAKLDPTILLHIQQHTGWTIEQVSEDVNARNFESPIFATYELLAAKLADLRAEENEILSFTCTGPSVTTSLQQQIENNQAAMRRGSRGSILSGRANVEPDVAQTTTVIPVHHLAKLSLSVGDDESDESSASDDRELVSPRYGTPSESGPSRHRRRRHAMTAFNPQHKPESSISAATKTPVVSHAPFNAFPFLPANPLLNAVAQQVT
jgi:serine/threonine protein kinase